MGDFSRRQWYFRPSDWFREGHPGQSGPQAMRSIDPWMLNWRALHLAKQSWATTRRQIDLSAQQRDCRSLRRVEYAPECGQVNGGWKHDPTRIGCGRWRPTNQRRKPAARDELQSRRRRFGVHAIYITLRTAA